MSATVSGATGTPQLMSAEPRHLRLNCLLSLNAEGVCLSHDETSAALLGLRGGSLVGRCLGDLNSQLADAVRSARQVLQAGQQSPRTALPAQTADGAPALWHVGVFALPDGAAVVTINTEPDLRAQAQRSLSRKQSLAQLAIRAGLLSWEYLPQSGSFTLDDKFAQLLGAGATAPTGTWLDALFPDDRPAVQDKFNACAAGEQQGFECQFRLRTVTSGYRWFQAWAEAVEQNDKGRVTRMIGLLQDCSADKLAAAALANARREAEQAGRAKSAFLAAMSHELRTPLNGVLGMLSLLERENLHPDAQDCVQIAIQSGNALFELINTILDFSRLDAGGLQAERSEFNLRAIAEDALDRVADEARQKGLDLLLRVAADVPTTIESDPGRLRQILQSLLSNAVKFTTQGRVVLWLASDPLGGGLRLTVADTGIGIEPALHARVFEPFTQADDRMNRAFGGTGIGLSLTRELVRLLGGELALDSVPGEGSSFTVTLPLTVLVHPPSAADSRALPLKGRRVLVFDPSAAVRESLAETLQMLGAAVELAASPAAVVSKGYDALVLADEPRGAVLGVLRALEAQWNVPVLLTSGLRKRPAGDEFQGLFDEALHKPVRAGALLASLQRCLSTDRRVVGKPTVPPTRAALADSRVLVVDDVRTNLTVAAGMLRKLGITAELVDSGAAAVDAVERAPFDLILMDCQMPGMTGLEATRLIRSRYPKGDGPKIVAMTANEAQADREACAAAGMHDFLAKPLLMSQLERVLLKWTGREAVARHVREVTPPASGAAPEKLAELIALLGPREILPILERYESDGTARIARMREQMLSGASSALLAEAHALKGSSANLGIVRIAELSATLEKALKAAAATASADALALLIDEFPGECMRVREHIMTASGS